MCPGHVCNYVIVDPAVTGDWLCDNVTPNIRDVFGSEVAKIFGKALLWVAYSEHKDILPPVMLERISTAYCQRGTLREDEKPVCRKLVYVTGSKSAVYMQEAAESEEERGMGTGNGEDGQGIPDLNLPRNNEQQLLLTIVANQNNLQRGLLDQANGLNNVAGSVRRLERSLNHLVRRIDANPARMMQQEARRNNPVANLERDDVDVNAVLVQSPRTLHQLWDEYIKGIGNNKPAKDFTRLERGRHKFVYCR